ncbi:MAG: chromosome segregation SMC family protein, partial [Pirellulales bacterium]
MLKSLELIGFKSFADKTRFEFDRGITAIVGPNGSGKSNVVDAIKWILGEQSAKSLRGTEMADVIFNGSDSRRSLGYAEATLTFDNASGLLPVDTPEVQIGRKVYRSGEGEYFINRQPARLRDVKDLFLGTGAACEAYSVIEQGKVDVLLQASTRDRRAIFEEAAGISRFKAKKREAELKLQRVDQNLLRLTDIVEEVEKRLRSVRQQAAKAQRYREHSERLRELRIHLGLLDYRTLSQQIDAIDQQVSQLKGDAADSTQQAESLESEADGLEEHLVELERALEQVEERRAQTGEQIATHQANREHAAGGIGDLEATLLRLRRQRIELSSRSGDLDQQAADLQWELQQAENASARLEEVVERLRAALLDVEQWLETRRGQLESRRADWERQANR